MPTISKRGKKPSEPRQSPNTGDIVNGEKKSKTSRTDVTEMEIKWNANARCPPCKSPYSYSSSPKPIPSKMSKKTSPKDPNIEKTEPYKNVMYDRRVIRGSNFAPPIHPLLEEASPFDRGAELRRRRILLQTSRRNRRGVLGTPPPVHGRRHEVVQTDKYLEELVSRPAEVSIDTQTDLFLERPPTPPYVPFKVGIDVGTEIGDGELFQFDAEAQPIIDVLVDACVEQSILEVAHEQELKELRKKQEEFLAQREQELAELRRLEAEEMRLQTERERRIQQDIISKELDEEMQKGITAAKLLQGHIAGLLPEILDNMEPASDHAKKEELMRSVCPWLSSEVAEEVGHIVDSREILTAIIHEIIKQRAEIYAGYREKEASSVLQETEPSVCEEENETQCAECYPCDSESKECSSIESIHLPIKE